MARSKKKEIISETGLITRLAVQKLDKKFGIKRTKSQMNNLVRAVKREAYKEFRDKKP